MSYAQGTLAIHIDCALSTAVKAAEELQEALDAVVPNRQGQPR